MRQDKRRLIEDIIERVAHAFIFMVMSAGLILLFGIWIATC
jgi:hypothetical protein